MRWDADQVPASSAGLGPLQKQIGLWGRSSHAEEPNTCVAVLGLVGWRGLAGPGHVRAPGTLFPSTTWSTMAAGSSPRAAAPKPARVAGASDAAPVRVPSPSLQEGLGDKIKHAAGHAVEDVKHTARGCTDQGGVPCAGFERQAPLLASCAGASAARTCSRCMGSCPRVPPLHPQLEAPPAGLSAALLMFLATPPGPGVPSAPSCRPTSLSSLLLLHGCRSRPRGSHCCSSVAALQTLPSRPRRW